MIITLQETYNANGYYFKWMESYEVVSTVYVDKECDMCDKIEKTQREKHYSIVVNDVTYLIPARLCVVTGEYFPIEYSRRLKYLTDKDQDQVLDYNKTVKEAFGIDIPEGYKADHNGENYYQTAVKTNKSKYKSNMYEIVQD
jgi:hypothetical protein